MQVQAIKSNTNFEAKRRNNTDDIETFVSLDDSQLRYCAYMNNNDPRENRRDAKKANALFLAIPIVDTIASAVLVQKRTNPVVLTKQSLEAINPIRSRKLLAKAPLSLRAGAAAEAGLFWAGALTLIGLYNVIKKGLTANSKSAKNFERTNPVTSFVVDMGIIFAGFIGINHLLAKSTVKSLNENPGRLITKWKNIQSEFLKLDKTNFAKKTMPKIQKSLTNFINNSPKLAKAGRFALANSVWILFGAMILNSMHNSTKKNRRIENDYQQLKQTQLEAAKFLAAKRDLENDILAQKAAAKVKNKPEPKKTKPVEAEPEEINDID